MRTYEYMAMFKADSDGTEVLGNHFCYGINFVEGGTSFCQGTGDFVDEDRASKTAGCRKTSTPGRPLRGAFAVTHRLPTMLP